MIGFSDSFPIVPFFEVVYALFEYLLEKKDFDVCEEVRLLAVGFSCRGEIKRVL